MIKVTYSILVFFVVVILLVIGSIIDIHKDEISLKIASGEKKDDNFEKEHSRAQKEYDLDKEEFKSDKNDSALEKFFEDNYQDNNADSNEDSSDFDHQTVSNSKERKKEGYTKYVLLVFDRGYKTTFSIAKPILDKYGFKASIFMTCNYSEKGKGMDWDQVRQLYNEGYDIQSHGLKHVRLSETKSIAEIESIIGGGKECLVKQGFNPNAIQIPYNRDANVNSTVDIIAKYFDFAFTGHSELMFLNCDGWQNFGYDKNNYYRTIDCRPYFLDATPTPTNKFAMKEWSHDRAHHRIFKVLSGDPFSTELSLHLFKKFVKVVNSQMNFNKDGKINAIPIVGYHAISRDNDDFTHPELFDLEMKYLYDNGFKVITLADLAYNEKEHRFYIKNSTN